ncbi:endonuclease/exonuclease/phosphatase family protein [Natribacillus halophilus]|uniref:Metal-dependent hydrolase, endonuclease/exonuclease/phosphatase family n=1 Tax=Natribacillus halophilus TaxID=549003 RepID=A0A1G8MTN8_9BACI|nr:endonuclease/exonuclease/phosphatase family protein [Natribacillus halophilus]SDI71408.1 Metal-dependent hydrolase, endonuclease/exonuclease/phosphatase family [Natribacillus halophilus]
MAAGIGADGELDLERTAQTLRESEAEIIGLQEVDVHWDSRSDFENQIEHLAEELDMEAFFAPIYSEEPEDPEHPQSEYGLAILSEYPIEAANNYEIARLSTQDPDPEPQPMPGFPEVLIDVNGTNAWFSTTHLDYRGDPTVREMQVADMQEKMAPHYNAMLVGDLNARPDADELQPLLTTFTDAWEEAGEGDGFTFPVGDPDRRIDYILTSPDIDVQSANTDHSPASDHLLVTSTVTLNPVNATNMKKLAEAFAEKEAFANESATRSLLIHLTTLEHYENEKEEEKLMEHMEGLRNLLNYQEENDLITEKAYNVLKADALAMQEER